MRVLLISPNRLREDGTAGKRGYRGAFPPLSLLQVAALTPPEHEVSLQDEAVQGLDLDAPCDLVGVTALTSAAPRGYDIADHFRARGIPVVMGGMHASACPEEALQHCDSVVIGEAEESWPRLLHDLQRGPLRRMYCSETYPDLATAPAPRRDLIDRREYLVPNTVQATRGCVHGCSFCSVTTFFGRHVRTRPAEAVAEEVRSLPGRLVVFLDDNIMAIPAYAMGLFELLVGSGKTWLGQASTTVLNNVELLRLAARSGCKGLFVGLETLSARALSDVNKSFNVVSKFEDVAKRLHDFGIGVCGAFIFGFDDDDASVFDRTAEFVDKVKIDLPQYSILTPLPATPLHAQMEAEHRIIDRNWTHYDGGHAVFAPRWTTPEKLEEGLKSALKYSYSRIDILRRLSGLSARAPLMWALNLAFRSRAIPFATGSTH